MRLVISKSLKHLEPALFHDYLLSFLFPNLDSQTKMLVALSPSVALVRRSPQSRESLRRRKFGSTVMR